MAKLSKSVVIVAAKRTAFGTMHGSLKGVSATDLAVHAAKAALDAERRRQARHRARHRRQRHADERRRDLLRAPRRAQGGTAHRDARAHREPPLRLRLPGHRQRRGADPPRRDRGGARRRHREHDPGAAPCSAARARAGRSARRRPVEDSLWSALTDSYCNTPMAVTAENLATKYGITRQQCDEYALSSQQRWAAANEAGRFKDEIVAHRAPDPKKGAVELRGRRAPAPAVDDGGAREALARLQEGRRRHGGQRVGHLRRRRCARADERGVREEQGPQAARAPRAVGRRRRGPEHHGHRPRAGHPRGARARGAEAVRRRSRSR